MKEIINDALEYVESLFNNDFSGHDFHHTYRVYQLANYIAKTEICDINKVCIIALLHDVDDYKISPKTATTQDNAKLFLKKHNYENNEIAIILKDISNISFSKGVNPSILSIEAKIVQDADRIDAIGAIGIARTFAYGGSHNRPIYDPNNTLCTINHFYEKLLKLESMMNTNKGKSIAKDRTIFLEKFLQQFFKEWNIEGL